VKKPFYFRGYSNRARPYYKYVGIERSTGKKEFFRTKVEVLTWEHLHNTEAMRDGTGPKISLELRVSILRWQQKLASFGETLDDACATRYRFLQQRAKSCEIPRLFRELIEKKRRDGGKDAHLRRIEKLGKALDEMFPGKLVSELTGADIENFLASLPGGAPKTFNTRRTLLAIVFHYANNKKRGYCSGNPAGDVDRAKEPKKRVEILQPIGELKKLLAAASLEMIPTLTIEAFAGIRRSEICKLDWREIELRREIDPETGKYGEIFVPAEKAKTGLDRRVPIEPNLAQWLWPFAKPSGRVAPTEQQYNYRRRKAVAAAGMKWPFNALRHSYGSYWLARFKDIGALAEQMGNSPTIIYKHYRRVVRSDEAVEYWKITPSQIGRSDLANVIEFPPAPQSSSPESSDETGQLISA